MKRLVREKKFDIYTDGSHKGKWGSWAFVIVQENKIILESSGRSQKTNSHRMEFQAAIEALRKVPVSAQVCLYTDSRELIKSLTNENAHTTINDDQILILNELKMKYNISTQWVKAHSGILYNERCDQLCSLARDRYHHENSNERA
jgi:ribonuclease HI